MLLLGALVVELELAFGVVVVVVVVVVVAVLVAAERVVLLDVAGLEVWLRVTVVVVAAR